MTSAARLLFWFSLSLVVLATLAPIEFRPVSGLPPQVERFGAFVIVTAALATGYPRYRLLGICGLVIAAGALEALQNLSPGRHGRVLDFEAKALGIVVGALFGIGAGRFRSGRTSAQGGTGP